MVKEKVKQRLKMARIGAVSLILGMEMRRDLESGTLTISQEDYSKSILEWFGMSECRPTNPPGYGPELFNRQPDETLPDKERNKRYHGIVGCLVCVYQVLRYDIMYAVPTGSPDCETQQDPHGNDEAHSPLPRGDNRLQHYVQEGKLQACSIFGLQLGQQPGQRKVHLMLHVDAVRSADELHVGATRPDCHVDHGGEVGRVGFDDEGCSGLLEYAD